MRVLDWVDGTYGASDVNPIEPFSVQAWREELELVRLAIRNALRQAGRQAAMGHFGE